MSGNTKLINETNVIRECFGIDKLLVYKQFDSHFKEYYFTSFLPVYDENIKYICVSYSYVSCIMLNKPQIHSLFLLLVNSNSPHIESINRNVEHESFVTLTSCTFLVSSPLPPPSIPPHYHRYARVEIEALVRIYRKLVSNCKVTAKAATSGSSVIAKPHSTVEVSTTFLLGPAHVR